MQCGDIDCVAVLLLKVKIFGKQGPKCTANLLQARCQASGGTSVAAAVQYKQSLISEQASQTPLEQVGAPQAGRLGQSYPACLDRTSGSGAAGLVPNGQHTSLARQGAGSTEAHCARDAPRNLYKGTPPIRLPPLPLKIIPRGPKHNLKYWKTVPHGLPEATEKGP